MSFLVWLNAHNVTICDLGQSSTLLLQERVSCFACKYCTQHSFPCPCIPQSNFECSDSTPQSNFECSDCSTRRRTASTTSARRLSKLILPLLRSLSRPRFGTYALLLQRQLNYLVERSSKEGHDTLHGPKVLVAPRNTN